MTIALPTGGSTSLQFGIDSSAYAYTAEMTTRVHPQPPRYRSKQAQWGYGLYDALHLTHAANPDLRIGHTSNFYSASSISAWLFSVNGSTLYINGSRDKNFNDPAVDIRLHNTNIQMRDATGAGPANETVTAYHYSTAAENTSDTTEVEVMPCEETGPVIEQDFATPAAAWSANQSTKAIDGTTGVARITATASAGARLPRLTQSALSPVTEYEFELQVRSDGAQLPTLSTSGGTVVQWTGTASKQWQSVGGVQWRRTFNSGGGTDFNIGFGITAPAGTEYIEVRYVKIRNAFNWTPYQENESCSAFSMKSGVCHNTNKITAEAGDSVTGIFWET